MKHVADTFGRITVLEEDDAIAKKQAEEDIQLYGSRPEPPEAIELDEAAHLSNLPPKRNASEFKAAVGSPARIHKVGESRAYNYQSVTALDWHSGASPLESWLNQSALPSVAPLLRLQPQPYELRQEDPITREIEEIKVFRNVHMAVTPEPTGYESDPVTHEIADLELDAQIYYRNIKDRYPLLPLYLVRRFAQANHDRAERLRVKRTKENAPSTPLLANRIQSFETGSLEAPEEAPLRKLTMSNTYQKEVYNPNPNFMPYAPQESFPLHSRPPPPLPPPSYFWTGGSPNRRPASVHSRSSSMNSSLHGNPKFDPQDQNPKFPDNRSGSLSADFVRVSAGLPLPPGDLGKRLSFVCEICGETIQTNRQLEWQYVESDYLGTC